MIDISALAISLLNSTDDCKILPGNQHLINRKFGTVALVDSLTDNDIAIYQETPEAFAERLIGIMADLPAAGGFVDFDSDTVDTIGFLEIAVKTGCKVHCYAHGLTIIEYKTGEAIARYDNGAAYASRDLAAMMENSGVMPVAVDTLTGRVEVRPLAPCEDGSLDECSDEEAEIWGVYQEVVDEGFKLFADYRERHVALFIADVLDLAGATNDRGRPGFEIVHMTQRARRGDIVELAEDVYFLNGSEIYDYMPAVRLPRFRKKDLYLVVGQDAYGPLNEDQIADAWNKYRNQ